MKFDDTTAIGVATNQEEEKVLDSVQAKVRSAENILQTLATKLQAVYRRYRERKRLKATKKKAGKGGKGKGKGKGKEKGSSNKKAPKVVTKKRENPRKATK